LLQRIGRSWHIAAFAVLHHFDRQRRIADIDQLLLANLD